MIDRLFIAALTFVSLAGGSVAIGSALLESSASNTRVVQLPTVHLSVKRAPSATTLAASNRAEPGQRATP